MLTGRGWWTLFSAVLMAFVGIVAHSPPLLVTGLALVGWICCEGLFFVLRVRLLRSRLRLDRTISDDRGPVATLWAGRSFIVRVSLSISSGRMPFLAFRDPVPFSVLHAQGNTGDDGTLEPGSPLEVVYHIECPQTGIARFEGVRLETSDLQGFFAHVSFLRDPVELRILPAPVVSRPGGPLVKRENQLPPPGIHRLPKAGSGTELLDLRDYQPGDPPRTIAWKVSARRGKLITREFESEVPVRCILFLDTSSSVRVPSPAGSDSRATASYRPLDRLIEIAAGAIRAATSLRDLTGLCLFDQKRTRIARPGRGVAHVNRLMSLLGEAGTLAPEASRANPDVLLPVAHALCREVYPDLLRPEVNMVPTWLEWLVGHPGHSRHWRGMFDWMHRNKRSVLMGATFLLPLTLAAALLLAALFDLPPWINWTMGAAAVLLVPLAAVAGWGLFLFSSVFSGHQRRMFRARKQTAAVLAVMHQLLPDGLQRMLEDDDFLSLHLQRFLARHQVPIAPPLYGPDGQYLFALPAKAAVLGKAILAAAAAGRDNELYVILADLLDLGDGLKPLLQAVKVAMARHHQVVVVCPWPRGVSLPGEQPPAPSATVAGLLADLLRQRLHESFAFLRREFARLGVPVVCAASDEPVPLVLSRMERLRSTGGRR